jgi:DNA-binding NarL/FixJ family response regulator
MPERVRAIVAEDSPLLRRGIEQVLTDAGLTVVGTFADAESMLAFVMQGDLTVDVAVVDIKMPPTFSDEGLVALESLRAMGNDIGVVLLSMYVDPSYALRALASSRSGVGYLLKDSVAHLDDFVESVLRVASGGSAIDPKIVEVLARRPINDERLQRLTGREREVLGLLAEGRSNRSIAESLVVNDKTIETHVAHIFQKLDLPPTTEHHRRVLAALTWLDR